MLLRSAARPNDRHYTVRQSGLDTCRRVLRRPGRGISYRNRLLSALAVTMSRSRSRARKGRTSARALSQSRASIRCRTSRRQFVTFMTGPLQLVWAKAALSSWRLGAGRSRSARYQARSKRSRPFVQGLQILPDDTCTLKVVVSPFGQLTQVLLHSVSPSSALKSSPAIRAARISLGRPLRSANLRST